MSSTTVPKTLDVLRKMFSAYGLPGQIVDNGPQFVASEFAYFVKQNGVKHTRSSPYHPGPAWIPAVVIERLGPLSYLVETKDHDQWRRHVDLLKELAVPEYRSPSATTTRYGGAPSVVSPGVVDPLVGRNTTPTRTKDRQEPETPRNLEADTTVAGTPPTSTPEAGSESSSTLAVTSAPVNPYSRRVRHPPNYYRPST